MDEPAWSERAALEDVQPPSAAPAAPEPEEPLEGDRAHSPTTDWRPWTAPVALIGGLVLAAIGGLLVDIPAFALGVKITSSHTPPGLAIADTFVQDVAFVLAAVYCAQHRRADRSRHGSSACAHRGWDGPRRAG